MDRVRPWQALRRVLVAPGFVLVLWLAQLGFAKLLAGPGRAAASTAMRGLVWFDDGHLLRAMAELIADNPAIIAAISMGLLAATILAGLFSLLAAPAILSRLDGERSLAWLLAACGRELPAVTVQTLYGLVFRGLGLGLAAVPLSLLGPVGLVIALPLAAFPVLVLDRARAAVVLDDERPFHPMTFLRAIAQVARRPGWWLLGTLLETLKLGLALATVALILAAGPSEAAIWFARGASLLTLLFGLWRVSLAVDTRRGGQSAPLTRAPKPAEASS